MGSHCRPGVSSRRINFWHQLRSGISKPNPFDLTSDNKSFAVGQDNRMMEDTLEIHSSTRGLHVDGVVDFAQRDDEGVV